MPVAERMTAEEYLALPEAQHSRPWSLVEGEVVVTVPTRLHSVVVGNLVYALEAWSRAKPGRGAASVPLDDSNVFAFPER